MNIFERGSMAWRRVLVLAVLSAVVTAALNCIPALNGTSFEAPATTMEVWIVLALYIVMNCNGWKEATLKTFAFFLVSQPLIYLFEVPFLADGWGLFRYYPYWAVWTVLTIPAAAMAFRIKKDDLLAAFILSLPNAIIIFTGFSWLKYTLGSFPSHLLATIFCFVVPFVLILMLLKQKRSRLVAILLAAVIFAAGFVTQIAFMPQSVANYPLENGNWTLVEPSPQELDITVNSEDFTVSSRIPGNYAVELISDDGTVLHYDIAISHTGGIDISKPH